MAGNTWMDRHFHLRSDVQCLDGRAGTLRGLALHGPSLIVTHLIVQQTPREQDDVAVPVDRVIVPLGEHLFLRQGFLLSRDTGIPARWIQRTEGRHVILSATRHALGRLRRFATHRDAAYVAQSEHYETGG